jgi:hypothetical protein
MPACENVTRRQTSPRRSRPRFSRTCRQPIREPTVTGFFPWRATAVWSARRTGRWSCKAIFNVPLLASGEGAEFVDYFHDDVARQDLNLRAALAVADDVVGRFDTPRNRLSVAAIALALVELHADDALLHGFQADVDSWLGRATNILEQQGLDQHLADGDRALLRPIRLELLSRAHLLADRPDLARDALNKAPVEVLEQRGLIEVLVGMTSEALRRQPTEILREIETKLASLPTTSHARANAKRALDALIGAERSRLADPYRITLPSPTDP